MIRPFLLLVACAAILSGCSNEVPPPPIWERPPNLPQPRRGLLPDMTIALPADWGGDFPTVPQGFKIEPIATRLAIPRQNAGPSEWRHPGRGGLRRQRACIAAEGFHRELHKISRQDPR